MIAIIKRSDKLFGNSPTVNNILFIKNTRKCQDFSIKEVIFLSRDISLSLKEIIYIS